MAITIVGTAESSKATGNAIKIAVPAGTEKGDLILLFFTGAGAGSTNASYGFVDHCAALSTTSGSDLYSKCYYRWSAGDDPANLYIGHSLDTGHFIGILVLRGVHADIWDVAPAHATYHLFEADTEDPTPEAITTNTNGALVVQFSCMLDGTTNSNPTTTQSGATIFIQGFDVDSANCLTHYEIKASAGVYAACTHNYPGGGGNGETHVLTLAVKPA